MKRIYDLIDMGEGEMLDFKKEISSVHRIAKTIVSFANHYGGTLLVGVDDDGKVSGARAEEEMYMLEQAANHYCIPPVKIHLHEWNVKGKTVVEAVIEKGDMRPYAAIDEQGKKWVYIRHRDQSLLASKIVVEVLKRQNSGVRTLIKYSDKEQALLEYLQQHHRITLKEYCQLLNLSRRRGMQILVNLVSVGVIRVHQTEKPEYYTLGEL